jgi:hypothetical protein
MACSEKVKIFFCLLAFPFAALGQTHCGASTPGDVEGPFYKAGRATSTSSCTAPASAC